MERQTVFMARESDPRTQVVLSKGVLCELEKVEVTPREKERSLAFEWGN